MLSGANEAFSRVLIDKALEYSGWNLLDGQQVRFELNTATGHADYVLRGQRGPLCVLEATFFQSMLHRAFNGEL
jgi:predicted type IV restriction endonuclease